MLETLPNWFWAIYYLALLITLVTSIYGVVRNRLRTLSICSMFFALTIPIISLICSVGRAEDMNEFEHLISQLQQGAIWSLLTIVGYLFLVIWWFLFLFKNKNEN